MTVKTQRRLDISLHTRKIVRGNSRRLVIYRDVIMGGGLKHLDGSLRLFYLRNQEKVKFFKPVVRGNISPLVIIFGNQVLIVFPKSTGKNKRNEVGCPSRKVGEKF